MSIGYRIKSRRKQLGFSVDKLAEMIGKNRATIYRYEKDDIENMPYDVITPLAEALNVSPAYLMGWDEKQPSQLSSDYNFLPYSVSAGLPNNIDPIMNDDLEQISIPDSIMGKWSGNKDIYFMKVNGESMNKAIPNGSLIAVKQIEIENLNEADMVVYSDGNDYSVKEFYRSEEKLIFRPNSKEKHFTDYISSINNEHLKIYGKVVLYIVEMD